MPTSIAITGWLIAIGSVLAARVTAARRRELIARSCHELRGPITAARLALELGERRGELSAERLGAVGLELGRAALALEDLGGAAADRRIVTRSRGARPAGDIVSMQDVVERSAEGWRAAAATRRAELRIGSSTAASVRCSRLRLAQAIGNLIANAIEHGGGAIELRTRSDGETVRFEVVDGGPGLPAPVEHLIRRARGGRGRRGRGLAIASAIAVDHGGRISAAPSERGARLVLELPAYPQARAAGTED